MNLVLTFVAANLDLKAVSNDHLELARRILRHQTTLRIVDREPEILAGGGSKPTQALDFFLTGPDDLLGQTGREKVKRVMLEFYDRLYDDRIDVLIEQDGPNRKKKQEFLDMDGTVLQEFVDGVWTKFETLDAVAELAEDYDGDRYENAKQRVADITTATMASPTAKFEDSLKARLPILEGVPLSLFERVRDNLPYAQGVREFIATKRADGALCTLISSGSDIFTEKAATIGFHDDHGNGLIFDENDRLTTQYRTPVLDKYGKRDIVLARAKEHSADPLTQCGGGGDGSNDMKFLNEMGFGGRGHHMKKAFRESTEVMNHIIHGDHITALHAEGYKEEEIKKPEESYSMAVAAG